MPREARRAGVLIAVAILGAGWIGTGLKDVREDDGYAIRDAVWFRAEAKVLSPGYHLALPGLYRVFKYPKTNQVADFSGAGVPWVSREGASLRFRTRIAYRVRPAALLDLHNEARGESIAEAVVRPALAQVLEHRVVGSAGPPVGTAEFRLQVQESLGIALAARGLDLVSLDEAEDVLRALPAVPKAAVLGRNVLLIGLDGADWDIIDPLLARGRLPHLAKLVREGTRARLRTITPVLSPVIWTTIATGKGPAKHGILDFLARAPDGSMVPVTSTLWKARPVWQLLGDAGVPVSVTAWWATWPAERVNGTMATDRIAYQLFKDVIARPSSSDPVAEIRGKTWPQDLFAKILPLVVKPGEIGEKDVAKLVNLRALGRPDADDRERLDDLRTTLASTRTYEAIGVTLLRMRRSGFHAIYNESTDTLAHVFMPFRPPKRADVDERRVAAFGGVVDGGYREADAMLGRLLKEIGPDWNVIVLSDHGFRHGDNRPATDPRIGHGPAADWHDRFGILILRGPDIRRGTTVADATVLDVAPTLLALYGLPVARDMDGRVLEEALEPSFLLSHPVQHIDSYERGPRPEEQVASSAQDPELMEKLRSLGYIAGAAGPTGQDVRGSSAGFTQDSARASNNRGSVLMSQGKLVEAQAEFERGLAAGGGTQSLINLASIHMIKGELDRARERLDETEKLDPEAKALFGMRGTLADLRGDTQAADRLLREAIRRDPADSRSHARLGHLFENSGKLKDALAEYRAAVRADPNNAEALNYIGNVLRIEGDLAGAEASYRRAVEADPKYPGGYNNLGLLLQERGQLDEAIALYRKGLEQSPRSPLLHNSLGSLLIVKHDMAGAEREIRSALDSSPKMAEAHNNLGILLAEKSLSGEARKEFQAAIEADPRSVDGHFNLAKVLLIQGERNAARGEFLKTLELNPRHLDAAIGAGEIAFHMGQDEDALRFFERAREIKPDIPRLRLRLGELYLRRGNRTRAAQEWHRSLALSSDQPELRKRLDELTRSGR